MKKEVREGYKMTELGEIPSGWKVNKLKNILEVCYGKSQKEVETENGIYKILGTGGVIGYTNEYLWNKPSVLIGRKGTIDKPMYIEEPFWTVDTLFYTKINNENNVKWIYYYLNNIDLKKYNEATGVPSLSVNNLNNIKVITPSLKEQEKIAEILSTVDEQIENTEKLIQKNQELKRGLMQQLLTKGIGHKEFKETELGEIPKEWEVKKIGEISDFCSNGFVGTATPYYSEKGTFYLMSNNVRENKIDTRNMIKVNDKFVSLYPRSKIYKDDMLTVQSGHIGTSCVVTQEYDNCNCHALIITRFKKRFVDSNFISYYLNSDKGKDRLSSIFVGSTIKHINVKDLVKFFVPVPEIYEQRKIVSILSSLDGKIEQYRNKKEKLEEMKKGLMQQLLKGKIRVV
ncbi:restriction endonuclease subunit S [Clostridium perfringens]